MIKNFKSNKIKKDTFLVSSNDTYFDDCPICQAMKQAEEEGRALTEDETKEAFEKSKSQGTIVGTSISNDHKAN